MAGPTRVNAPVIPPIPDRGIGFAPILRRYLEELTAFIQREFRRRSEDNVAIGNVLLLSPNGSVYSVTVGDDGTLTTTLVSS